MAYDKAVDSTVLENGLSAIADAIREKGELGDPFTSPLTFPSGFVSAIEGLSGGGAPEMYIEEVYDQFGYLTRAILHGNYTKVRKYLFYMSSSMTSVELPQSVQVIGDAAFQYAKLSDVSLPSGITNIGSNAFGSTSVSFSSLPSGVTRIGSYAFSGCNNITSMILPSSLQTLEIATFNACKNLISVVIPASVINIKDRVFSNCSKLNLVTFNGIPTSIAVSTFQSCSNLTTINVPWAEGAVANAPWGATNATIHYNVSGV